MVRPHERLLQKPRKKQRLKTRTKKKLRVQNIGIECLDVSIARKNREHKPALLGRRRLVRKRKQSNNFYILTEIRLAKRKLRNGKIAARISRNIEDYLVPTRRKPLR